MNPLTTSISKTPLRTPPYLVALGLAILIFSVYWQVGGYSFIAFDDDVYVYENPHVRKGLTLEESGGALRLSMAQTGIP